MQGFRQRWSALPATARWCAAVVAFVMLLLVVLGLLSNSDVDVRDSGKVSGAPSTSDGKASPTPSALGSPPTPNTALVRPGDTSSADEYAAGIARVVLGTNPRDHDRADYLDVLLGEVSGDVAGETRERIEPVIESALPDEYQWLRQRDYGQVNTFTVEHVWEPEDVDSVRDEIPAGFFVRTVAGTQTTRFLDENGDQARSSLPRLLTVFAYCPDGGACSLFSIPQEVVR